jgi:hypothetical protein
MNKHCKCSRVRLLSLALKTPNSLDLTRINHPHKEEEKKASMASMYVFFVF